MKFFLDPQKRIIRFSRTWDFLLDPPPPSKKKEWKRKGLLPLQIHRALPARSWRSVAQSVARPRRGRPRTASSPACRRSSPPLSPSPGTWATHTTFHSNPCQIFKTKLPFQLPVRKGSLSIRLSDLYDESNFFIYFLPCSMVLLYSRADKI